ncbi:YfhO family protein [Flavobacterium tegetincola]|uniref:YfhO family protein n=1 Tax=Flavobacterium tegetincola TaxID=150172 RepID=UPI0003FB5F96|nr:YfhO family protein [Flavobacterium tegetincola]
MKFLNKFYPHLLAFFGFIIISLFYFYPVLQGKQLSQSDIVQYTGMAKEQNDFRAAENTEPYWTNSAFGGMPTYQMGANYPNDYIGALDDFLRFLPRPADYLFLYFLSFYGLLLVLKVDPLKAFIGALAFGFSTYMIIILGVGHNAKAHAIAYMPLVLAGVLLVFQRKYVVGGILTMLAAALEINANHFQMTYYLLILILIVALFYSYQFIKSKEYKPLLTAFGIFAVAGIFAIGSNATNLLATAEYADFSMRGKSELSFNPDGSKNETTSAMDYDYITEYSYGIAESLNLIAPRLFGGGNSEKLGKESNVFEFISKKGASPDEALNFTQNYGATYWGDQPIVAAPAYLGAVVFMLFVLAMFIDKRKIKYAFLIGAIFTLMLSWGKNFAILTNIFIDIVPLYDKFRAVSSIQVIVELCIPILAIMGLQSFFKAEKAAQVDALKKTAMVSLGMVALLFVSKFLFDFAGPIDARLQQMFAQTGDPTFGTDFMDALRLDRKDMYSADVLRSGFLIAAGLAFLWFYTQEKLSQMTTVLLVGVFMVGDLVLVDRKYVDTSGFVSAREVREPFQPTQSDLQILEDTSNFRVYEVNGRLQARTSYFHKSLSGYSAVRPRRMDQLFNYQIDNGNMEVLNMLNTKYVIQVDDKNQEFPALNDKANGNAWFVQKMNFVNSADAEMKALDKFDSKNEVIINNKEFTVSAATTYSKDSLATINLIEYKPNYAKYVTVNKQNGLAVFSEIYYPKGWIATIDGKEVAIFRTNYTLRGLEIPAGKHTVEFKFEPQVVKTGSTIVLLSGLGMLLLIGGGIYFERKKRTKEDVV